MVKVKTGYWCQICERWHRLNSRIGKAHTSAIDHRKTERMGYKI